MALLLGTALGNVLRGLSIGPGFEYEGTFLQLLNPYALMIGVTTLAAFMMQGAIYLTMKTEGKIYSEATVLVRRSIIFFIVSYAITSLCTLVFLPHLADAFRRHPLSFAAPVLAMLSIANVPRLVSREKYHWAFIFSSITISLMLVTVAINLYPVLLQSTIDAAHHVTVYNGSASGKSLGIMLIFVAIGLPLVLIYTVFVYRTFWGRVKLDDSSY